MSLNNLALVSLIQAKAHLHIDGVASLHVDAEFLGVGDGSDVTFDLDNTPIDGSLILKVNDVLQVEDTDFTISAATVTFETAPTLNYGITASYDYSAEDNTFEAYDDELLENIIEAATKKAEDYTGRAFIQGSITERHTGNSSKILRLNRRPAVTITSVRRYHYERPGTGDGSTVVFTLNNTPITGTVVVYKNGSLQIVTTDYTISGVTITFVSAPSDGDIITANYKTAIDFIEQLNIGRLYRESSWIQDYIYEVVYTAGYATTRAATQALVPEAVQAVLLMIAYLYENRTDQVKSESVVGIGSVTYDISSQALKLLNPLRVNVL